MNIPIHFIKVDVEGAEHQVLKGGIQTIKKDKPIIVFKHGLGGGDYYGTTPESIHDLLAGQGDLRLFLMSDWPESNGHDSLSRERFCEQFDSGSHYYFMAAA